MSKQTTKQKNKAWPILGSVRVGEYGQYVVLEDNVTVLVDNEEVELRTNKKGQRILNVQTIPEKVERLIANGFIKEDEAEERREKAQEISEWLKAELVLTPPKKG